MIIISHRGNTSGPNPKWENEPNNIQNLVKNGIPCEVDVWRVNNKYLYLGHDEPQYVVPAYFFNSDLIWAHCKNLDAITFFVNNNYNCKYFWHQNDDFALTSNNKVWTYPGKPYSSESIVVDLSPNWRGTDYGGALGVCVDYL